MILYFLAHQLHHLIYPLTSKTVSMTDGPSRTKKGAWKLLASIAFGFDNLFVFQRHIRCTTTPNELFNMVSERTTSLARTSLSSSSHNSLLFISILYFVFLLPPQALMFSRSNTVATESSAPSKVRAYAHKPPSTDAVPSEQLSYSYWYGGV